jgi:hypothetical protein
MGIPIVLLASRRRLTRAFSTSSEARFWFLSEIYHLGPSPPWAGYLPNSRTLSVFPPPFSLSLSSSFIGLNCDFVNDMLKY